MAIKMYCGGDKVFLKACDIADVKATNRQYRRYARQSRGKALTAKPAAEQFFAKFQAKS